MIDIDLSVLIVFNDLYKILFFCIIFVLIVRLVVNVIGKFLGMKVIVIDI